MQQRSGDARVSGWSQAYRAVKHFFTGPPRPDSGTQIFTAVATLLAVVAIAVPAFAGSVTVPYEVVLGLIGAALGRG